VVGVVGLRLLFGIHLAPQIAEIGDGVEASRPVPPRRSKESKIGRR